jgi:hypothetical protein
MTKPHANKNPQGGRAVEIASRKCVCGHNLEKHVNGEDCTAWTEPKLGKYCECYLFRPKGKYA